MKILIIVVSSISIIGALSISGIDAWDMQHHGILNFIGGLLAGTINTHLMRD